MEETQGSASFQPMEKLLETWLAGARLAEIARIVQLAKAELARRGITLTWSIDPRATAMKLVGHKTEAIYRRYAIVVESDLLAGGEKLEGLLQSQGLSPRTVLPFPQSR